MALWIDASHWSPRKTGGNLWNGNGTAAMLAKMAAPMEAERVARPAGWRPCRAEYIWREGAGLALHHPRSAYENNALEKHYGRHTWSRRMKQGQLFGLSL